MLQIATYMEGSVSVLAYVIHIGFPLHMGCHDA
jgi:hypothetical protein